jgi:hypothetical protein
MPPNESLRDVLIEHPEITHISSISVMEHIPGEERIGIMKAINEHFQGQSLVMTFEYHATERYFEHQLTARTASAMAEPLTRYYLDAFEASPVSCEDAIQTCHSFGVRKRRLFFPDFRLATHRTPRWYPVALRFLKA